MNPHISTWPEPRNAVYLQKYMTVIHGGYRQIRRFCVQNASKDQAVPIALLGRGFGEKINRMANEDLWAKWWAARSEDQRAQLKHAAGQDRMDTETVQFVLGTNPPIGLVGGRWQHEVEFSWSISPSLREFIQIQQ